MDNGKAKAQVFEMAMTDNISEHARRSGTGKFFGAVANDTSDRSCLRWRKWNVIVLFLFVISACLPAAVNVGIDPYDLFCVSPIGIGPQLNQRFHHIRRLESKPQKFNVLMMGTSVMGLADPRVIDEEVRGAKAYNMSFFVASPSDLLLASEYLWRRGALPSRVIVGVDTFLFQRRPASLPKQFSFPAEVSGESTTAWWMDAIYSASFKHSLTKAAELIPSAPPILYDLDRGNYTLPRSNAAMRANPMGHAENVFRPIAPIVSAASLVESEFVALGKLAIFFAANKVEVLWLIEPNSQVIRNAYGEQNYQALKTRIAAQLSGDIVDLSDASDFQNTPGAWHDMKHLTEDASRSVLRAAIRRSTTFSRLSYALE